MPVLRTFSEQVSPALLANNSGATYTASYSLLLQDCERVVFILIGHASCDVALNASFASDSSGTGAENVLATALDCDESGKIWTLEVSANDVPAGKPYLSATVTRTAGNYSLLQEKHGLRYPGNFTHDSTYNLSESRVVAP